MRAVRPLWIALVLAPLACGLTYSPGDFLADTPALASVVEAGSSAETGSPLVPQPDANAPDAAAFDGVRILILGGHRDALAGETGGANVTETLRTTFSSTGVLGPFAADAPPPVAASWIHAEIAGGNLYVHNNATLVRASFDSGEIGAWSQLALNKPFPGILRPWLLDQHGFLAGPPVFGKATYALPFLPSGELGEWSAKTGMLSVDRSEITLAHSGNLVYALGGRRIGVGLTQADSMVEVAKLNANGELSNFLALSALGTNGPGTPEFTTYAPIVATGSGRIVVLGGAALNGTGSTAGFAATITDLTTGALSGWTALPPLPEALTGCALVVTRNHILVFGGQRTAGTSDTILDLELQPNGMYGTAWIPIGKLPGARSGLVAVTY